MRLRARKAALRALFHDYSCEGVAGIRLRQSRSEAHGKRLCVVGNHIRRDTFRYIGGISILLDIPTERPTLVTVCIKTELLPVALGVTRG